jgi:hypothetical protein
MIAVADRSDAWVGLSPDLKRLPASLRLAKQTINESEMALFHECTLQCAQKELDTADIVRDAMFHH